MTDTDWVTIEATNRTDSYITGYAALNLADPASGHAADWHQTGWMMGTDRNGQPLRPATTPRDLDIIAWIPTWRERQLFDCRAALRQLGHPEGNAPEPVWCARHIRAIIELALSTLDIGADIAPTVTPHDIGRYLDTFRQLLALHWWIRKFGEKMTGAKRAMWYDWQQQLHPNQYYDTDYPLPWPVFWSRETDRR